MGEEDVEARRSTGLSHVVVPLSMGQWPRLLSALTIWEAFVPCQAEQAATNKKVGHGWFGLVLLSGLSHLPFRILLFCV